MTLLYQLISQLLYFVILPFAWLAAWSDSIKWRERMAFSLPESPSDLWFHAASVGEVKIASYLIKYLFHERPEIRIVLTVVTDAGYRTARDEVGRIASVRYLPLDAAVPVSLTMDRIRPSVIGITETEIWPNLILAAKARNIPVILINGRMSEKAQKKYRWIRSGISHVLSAHEHFFFKTQGDADRYARFGVGTERSTVVGDMKFDAPLVDRSPQKIAELRKQAGVSADAFLLVAGSTRPGEEELLCQMYARLSAEHPRLRLLLVPRHVDRTDEIKLLIAQLGMSSYIFGEPSGASSVPAIVVVDKMGLLSELYTAADLAFVGGTLVDIGGHNILEPVWAGTPVLYGPFIGNVTEAAAYIEQHNYGRKVASAEELAGVISELYNGRLSFHIKTADEYRHSPTALIGDFILRRLTDA